MIRGDTIEFENDISTKHNAKNTSFSPEEDVEIKELQGKPLRIYRISLSNLYS